MTLQGSSTREAISSTPQLWCCLGWSEAVSSTPQLLCCLGWSEAVSSTPQLWCCLGWSEAVSSTPQLCCCLGWSEAVSSTPQLWCCLGWSEAVSSTPQLWCCLGWSEAVSSTPQLCCCLQATLQATFSNPAQLDGLPSTCKICRLTLEGVQQICRQKSVRQFPLVSQLHSNRKLNSGFSQTAPSSSSTQVFIAIWLSLCFQGSTNAWCQPQFGVRTRVRTS